MCKRKSRGTKSGQRKSTTYNESLTHVKVKGEARSGRQSLTPRCSSEKVSAKRVRSPGMPLRVGRSGGLCPNPHHELSHCQEQPGKRAARDADSDGTAGGSEQHPPTAT